MESKTFSATVWREEGMFVARCSEVGTVSQGESIEKALENLKEATELYLEEFKAVETEKPFITIFEVQSGEIAEGVRV